MKKINVLIFPSGGENAINIYDSLKYNLHFNLFGATSIEDYSASLYKKENFSIDNYYITDLKFIEKFNELLNKFSIDYVIPTHDTIALYLMEHQGEIKSQIVCSPVETTRIANSKKKIIDTVKGKWYCPKTYNSIEEIDTYPVFLKPDIGAGAKGTLLAKTKEETEKFINNNSDIVITEFLPGEELTVDCFTDKNGKLIFIGPRTRERITMGISFTSKTLIADEKIEEIANDLNSMLNFNGAWFFQVKRDINNNYKIMEFSVRQAGTMALYRQLGINFAALSLFNAMGFDIDILFNNYNLTLNRRLENAYKFEYNYDKIYIDFDDTIIVNDQVNTMAIKYIYQCINKNKEIFLITKHSTDIKQDLQKYRIDPNIFAKIIVLNDNERKVDYIDDKNSIFIDNYYIERKLVREKKNIPVFDVDAIECLLDYSDM